MKIFDLQKEAEKLNHYMELNSPYQLGKPWVCKFIPLGRTYLLSSYFLGVGNSPDEAVQIAFDKLKAKAREWNGTC